MKQLKSYMILLNQQSIKNKNSSDLNASNIFF